MSFFQFLFLFCQIGILIFIEFKWKILSTPYNKNRLSHQLTSYIIPLLCVILAILFYFHLSDSKDAIEYPLKNSVANYNPYIQQFDAFQKKQLHIDVTPSDRLIELDNPYDPAQRQGIYYLWDRAFYDGHFYSYFGIGPIISVYYPYYLVTGNLPSDSLVVGIFLLITAFVFPLCIFEWAGQFSKRIPLSILSIGAIAATLGTNVFLTARGVQHFYYIAVLSGMAFSSLFLFCLLNALSAQKRARYVYYAFSGIFFSLIFLSRLNIAVLIAFIILPFLWYFIIRRQDEPRPIKKILFELIALGTPVFITLIFTFWFNNARFSSPFDFGTNYQLTVSDISKNKLIVSDGVYAIYHYFLQGTVPSEMYPYITLSYNSFTNYGRYVYVDANLGLFATPLMLGLLLAPVILFNNKYTFRDKVFAASSLIGVFTVAWLNFCKGGVIFRYTSDLTLIAALTSLILLFKVYEKHVSHTKWAKYTALSAISLFLIYSIVISIKIALISNGNLSLINEETLSFIKLLFPFK